MKKSTLAILTTVITFLPLTAFAQQAQTNVQTNNNSAAAVGTGNFIRQNTNQTSIQNQLDLGAYGVPATPNVQTSVQGNANSAAAIGHNNYLNQNANQQSVQGQVDIKQYLPNGYGH
ncbi:hypothetical protein NIES4102_12880 [Chondrocystis sp. NIES-4102]|nr:hypothetical protein NIES4102_12880 [Chondrocystis sp. NIES-4102]